jgi:hypothetical protein
MARYTIQTEEVKTELSTPKTNVDDHLEGIMNEYLASPANLFFISRFKHKIKLIFSQLNWQRKELEDIKRYAEKGKDFKEIKNLQNSIYQQYLEVSRTDKQSEEIPKLLIKLDLIKELLNE